MSIDDDLTAALAPKDMPIFSEVDGTHGKGALLLPQDNAQARDLVEGVGLDPDAWQISGKVNTRRWMRYDGNFLYYYKFDVVAGESPEGRELHIDDLIKQIRRRTKKPVLVSSEAYQTDTFVFVCSDWQVGKSENGFGSEQTIERFRSSLLQAVQQIKNLRKTGVSIDKLAILSVGDLVEGCDGHYAIQNFTVDLDRRHQVKVVRELLTEAILTLSPLFGHTTIAAVAGNHGENRKDGKAFTTLADNDDVAAPEAVKEAFDLAGWGDRLTWFIPEHELTLCIDLGGVKVGLVHGHQFKGGVNALKKAHDWWGSQVFGLEAVNDAQILLSGHFHSLHVVNVTAGRTWIQAPTIDPGSAWFTNTTGTSAIPAQMCFVATQDSPTGFDYLRTLVSPNV